MGHISFRKEIITLGDLLIEEFICDIYPCAIPRVEALEGAHHLCDHATNLVELLIVIPVGDMISSHYLQLSKISLIFVLKETAGERDSLSFAHAHTRWKS